MIGAGGTGGSALVDLPPPDVLLLLALLQRVRVPVVYRGPAEARAIAVEIRAVSYLPADALAGRGACLLLEAHDD